MELIDTLLSGVSTPTGAILFLLLIMVQLWILGGGFVTILVTALRKRRPRVIAFVSVGLNYLLGAVVWLVVEPTVFLLAPFGIAVAGSAIIIGKSRSHEA